MTVGETCVTVGETCVTRCSCYDFIKYTILLRSQMMSSAPTDYSALSKRKERLFLLRDSEIVPDILYNDRVKSKMPSVPLFYSDIIAGEI